MPLSRAETADAILQSMTEGLIVSDPAGNVTSMNPMALRLHGFASVDEARRGLHDFSDTFEVRASDGGVLPVDRWPLARVLRGETFSRYEVRVRRRDTGAEWWGSFGGTPVRDAAGRMIQAVLTLRDVTAQKRTEQELSYVTTHARCLLWHGWVTRFEDGGFWWDTQVFDEDAAQAFLPLARRPGERYTEAWYRHRLPDDRARTDRISVDALLSDQSHYNTEFGCRSASGETRWFDEQVYVEPQSLGDTPLDARQVRRWRVVGVCVDVTERRRAEERRHQAQEEASLLVAKAHCLLWRADVTDDGGEWLRWDVHFGDDAAAQAQFRPDRSTPGRDFPAAWHASRLDQDRAWMDRDAVAHVRAGRSYVQEFRYRRDDGQVRWMREDVRVEAVAPGRWRLVGVSTDVTDRRRAEDEREQLLRQVQEGARRQRTFFRDVLASVTEGKLRLCDSAADLPAPGAPYGTAVTLSPAGGLGDLRGLVREAALAQGFPEERWQDLVTAASEAGMNAVVHAGGGEARVGVTDADTVQVWLEDRGPGITMEHLPQAALAKGYTTAGTLGHGMKMMLQTVDRLWLLTGPSGTTVVLEQDRVAPPPKWL